ncbi:hypothetical protein [Pigmentiphaga sp.]|uniref:hypothetical protein n=1 Tax=Pigmentiphaga sp. TaxID=1977564 RepID=UPI00128C932F|nr:hypothetical protein [Pigmentiphaga sp.]MPS29450.1 hypothetical protein [Alcaligenaceae bacterium SAGV5]MPS55406.1 hypothetical protein [Alcaligenaceae bacterium SAGV3]MPT60097.1 hypothetical protein [Alcaligenaceae bacterium]
MATPNDPYRILNLIVARGDLLPPVSALALLLLSIWVWLAHGYPVALPIGAALAAFLYLILRSYVELVRVIVDMLLPK